MYAIIENGVVVNTVEWDGDVSIWQPPSGTQAVLIQNGMIASIGCTYANGAFSAPAA
jgi:hypothetical protein